MALLIPPVSEERQRALNGTPFWPYCDRACVFFEQDYGTDPFCTATTNAPELTGEF